MISTRPQTLRELASRVAEGASFRSELADFLDEFKESPVECAFSDAPLLLAEIVDGGRQHDSFLAATAEHLCRRHGMSAPEWAFEITRSLDQPIFDFTTREGRLFLLKDSPSAFKARNLFVSGAVLDRV